MGSTYGRYFKVFHKEVITACEPTNTITSNDSNPFTLLTIIRHRSCLDNLSTDKKQFNRKPVLTRE
jgi:hypothetical protein